MKSMPKIVAALLLAFICLDWSIDQLEGQVDYLSVMQSHRSVSQCKSENTPPGTKTRKLKAARVVLSSNPGEYIDRAQMLCVLICPPRAQIVSAPPLVLPLLI